MHHEETASKLPDQNDDGLLAILRPSSCILFEVGCPDTLVVALPAGHQPTQALHGRDACSHCTHARGHKHHALLTLPCVLIGCLLSLSTAIPQIDAAASSCVHALPAPLIMHQPCVRSPGMSTAHLMTSHHHLMLLQGCLYIRGVHSAVVQIDQAAEPRQDEAMVVGLGSDRVLNQVDKLEPGKLAQACNLCQGSNLVAPCSGYLHPASVRFHARS